jgi:hypothetical protein
VNTEPKKEKRGRGRPSKYEGIDLTFLSKLAAAGLSDRQMAEILEIAESTFREYKKNEDFSAALKKAKGTTDDLVEQSLFERARGYSHPEDKIISGKYGVEIVPTIKHYPPDTTACIFWLKNRRPDRWRDKQEVEHSGNVGVEHSAKESLLGKLKDAIPGDDNSAAGDG